MLRRMVALRRVMRMTVRRMMLRRRRMLRWVLVRMMVVVRVLRRSRVKRMRIPDARGTTRRLSGMRRMVNVRMIHRGMMAESGRRAARIRITSRLLRRAALDRLRGRILEMFVSRRRVTRRERPVTVVMVRKTELRRVKRRRWKRRVMLLLLLLLLYGV